MFRYIDNVLSLNTSNSKISDDADFFSYFMHVHVSVGGKAYYIGLIKTFYSV